MLQFIKQLNFILACDSYKVSHRAQYPSTTGYIVTSVVPRKSPAYADSIVAMGQTFVAEYLASVTITIAMIDEAEVEINEQGYDFDRASWEQIVNEMDGKLPLAMWGVEEGRLIKPQTPILTLINSVKGFGWLCGYVETLVQRIIWKMTTVATVSRACYKLIGAAMQYTGSDMTMLEYKLHNFGDRGADGFDAAIIAAIGHAALFSGSDCLSANSYIKKLYNTKKVYLSSVVATEHSSMCSWSDAEAKDDYEAAVMAVNCLDEAVERTKRGIGIPLVSVVIDTYDDERFVSEYLGTRLKDRIVNSGGKMVARPDSGDPLTKPLEITKILGSKFGETVNAAGYTVVAPCVGTLQGDGITVRSIPGILNNYIIGRYSIDNINFGMGGGLTHEAGRDEFSFSMKAVALHNGTDWVNLLKSPKSDPGKKSLSGFVRCLETEEGLEVVTSEPEDFFVTGPGHRQWLDYGCVRNWEQSFDDVRVFARA